MIFEFILHVYFRKFEEKYFLGSQTDKQKIVPKPDKAREEAIADARAAEKAKFEKLLDLVSTGVE